MEKLLRYELIYPDVDQIKKFQENIGDSHNKILAKRAADSASDIYYLEDENEKLNQIYRFIYYYLLCYEQTSGANELILQNQNEELERNLKTLSQKYNKLMNQTSNAVDVTKYTQLVEKLKTLQGTLSYEQNQRADAEEQLQQTTTKYNTLVKTVEANREKLEDYSKLQEDLKKAISVKDSLAKYANTLQKENEELKEQLKQFENLSKIKIHDNSAEINQLQQKLDALRQENREIKDAYEELNSKYIDLRMQSEF